MANRILHTCLNASVGVPYNPLMNLTNFTMSALVKFNNFYSGTCQGNVLMMRGEENSPGFYGLEVSDNPIDGNDCGAFDTSKFALMAFAPVPANYWNTPNRVHAGQWVRLAATYDGTYCKTYINGQLDLIIPTTIFPGTSTDSMVIGRNYSNLMSFPYWFDGAMDDLIIYDGALEGGQIDTFGCEDMVMTQPLDTAIMLGSSAIFSIVSPAAGVSYQWQVNNGNGFVNVNNGSAYSGSTTNTLSVSNATINMNASTFRCVVTSAIICQDTSASATLTVNSTTGIESLDKEILNLYPNPAVKSITIQHSANVGSFQICDMQGRVAQQISATTGNTTIALNQPAGIYIVRGVDKNGKNIAIRKLVVE